ncbi:hypothetical protein PU630_02615 [Microbacterium horticulturae]|uniref:DUF6602 domain-containing protein n=1 Tax=Microbacterium horticulturae TaxID=3028316 RepID=A0ABY8C3Q9_9MICO|nr:DUF6602 domain-containing protein [Microbacterium sp. KACC 23027]WEG09478.1 hypothetical protein PU630_02615 [Microbacterium sp. KACC 23027]
MTEPFDLAKAYTAKQNHMLTGLGLMPQFTDHPGAKGDATEEQWTVVLREFLPQRYGVGPIFAIDSLGRRSEQIDIGIFDRQYSPLFFEQGDVRFVPVESVYAVCEVKSRMNKVNLDYARDKVASVRQLHRTSAEIRHAGGTYPPQHPDTKPILGVFLSTDIDWGDIRGAAAVGATTETQPAVLDLGIAVRGGAFDRTDGFTYAPLGQELIWFATRLYRALSRLGTALAIDLDAYYLPLQPPAG